MHWDDGVDQNVEVALSLGDGIADALRRRDYADRVVPDVLDVLEKAGTLAAGQAFALYLDAVLVALVAVLGLIVLSDSFRQWYGYVVLKKPFTSSEVVVMAGGGSAGRMQTAICQHDHDEQRFKLPHGTGCC